MRIALALSCAVWGLGCGHLRPTLQPDLEREAPLPLRAALVLGEDFRSRTDTFGKFGTLGPNTWVCQTGEALAPALEQLARSIFRDVQVVATAAQADRADVILSPQVVELRQVAERDGFWIAFRLAALATGPSGTVLNEQYVELDEGSAAMAIFGAGTGLGSHAALLAPTEKAMNRVLTRLSIDLRKRFTVTVTAPAADAPL